MRIVGCGNLLRGDDAAGILVAQRLVELGIPAIMHSGEALGLINAWSGCDDVLLIDAVVTGSTPGTVHLWDASQQQLPSSSHASSHGIGVAEAIELARTLGVLPKRLRVYGMEGREFRTGAEVSPEVRTACEEVVRRISTHFPDKQIVINKR